MTHAPASQSTPQVTSRAAAAALPHLTGARMALEDARRAVWQGIPGAAAPACRLACRTLEESLLPLRHALAISDDQPLQGLVSAVRAAHSRLLQETRADGSLVSAPPEWSSYSLQSVLSQARSAEVLARALAE